MFYIMLVNEVSVHHIMKPPNLYSVRFDGGSKCVERN